MANELPNATALMHDATWRDYLKTASVFVATEVYGEADTVADHETRLKMARDVMFHTDLLADQLVALVSVQIDVCSLGNSASAIPQETIIAKVRGFWTKIAKERYPNL